MKILVFDIWGDYAHFKKIYATTSALTYLVPPKTSLYGFVGAILGLEKTGNQYLKPFQNKQCLMGIGVPNRMRLQRINMNLRPDIGPWKTGETPKPTMMEFVYRPYYRVYFSHKDEGLFQELVERLVERTPVYTPTLGLASLVSNFKIITVEHTEPKQIGETVDIKSLIPMKKFNQFDKAMIRQNGNEIIEQSLYPVEMDLDRNVTERDDILLDRTGKTIPAIVSNFYKLSNIQSNVVLF